MCLQLAAEAPEEVDAIAAALVAHIDQASTSDRELLGALMLLVSREGGVSGARRLGQLDDPRALEPLVHAGETREVEVAVAAAEALVAYPESIEPLSRWVRDERLAVEVRQAAARSLGALDSDAAADALLIALRTRGMPSPLRSTLLETVESAYPGRQDELAGQVTRDGAAWLAAGGAFGLGYTMSMAGAFGRAELAGFGAVSGGVAGGTLGWVAGRAWPIEASDAAFITVTGATATAHGSILGASFGGKVPWWTGLGAGAVGYTTAAALQSAHKGTILDSFEAGGFSTATAVALAGTAALADRRTRWGWGDEGVRTPLLVGGLGGLSGLAVGHALAPAVKLQRSDAALLGLASSYGLAAGLLLPGPQGVLPWMGLGYGSLVGYGLAGLFEIPADHVFGAASGAVVGGTVGLGIGMIAGPSDVQEPVLLTSSALLGSAVGLGVGGILSRNNEDVIDKGDVLFTGLVSGWATWQSVGWYTVARPNMSNRRTDGVFVLGPAVATGVAGALSPFYDVPISYSFTGISMGLWGGYLGGSVAELSGGGNVLPYALLGSNIGVAAGIVGALPPIHASPLVIGIANAGGVLGGSVFALGAAFIDDRTRPILAASLIGAGVGFGTGVIAGAVIHRHGGTREVAGLGGLRLPGRWTLMPAAFTDEEENLHLGARISVIEW
ncbi:MAG: hypothetical protein EP330_12665 [Deltaproteobacteria bacterium]|nr:MAG: hypothetical protein EP330_12665 [Deltaproteobacteria bacterium]